MSEQRLAELENALGAVREALSRHPRRERYEPGWVIVCAWERAVVDITATLDTLDIGATVNGRGYSRLGELQENDCDE